MDVDEKKIKKAYTAIAQIMLDNELTYAEGLMVCEVVFKLLKNAVEENITK